MRTCQHDKSSLCQHHGVLFITSQKRKEHAIFKRSPFITWKLYRINWKQKQTSHAISILTGLMDRQEEHQGEWGKSRKELELCCLFEIWTSWFLNANLTGSQLCPLTETRYIAIFKYKIKYIFIGKITVVHIPSGKGIVLVQSMSTRSHILLIFYFCWPFYMNKGAKNK